LVLPEAGLQIAVPPRDLAPGEEIEECYFKSIDNAEALDVVEIETAAALGIHHFNIWKTSIEHAEGWDACPDSSTMWLSGRMLVDGSAAPVDHLFPPGVAVAVAPQTMLVFNLHMINATPDELRQQLVLNLTTTAEPVEHYSEVFGFSIFDIELPPRQTTTLTRDCQLLSGTNIVTLSSHFHARGDAAFADLYREDGAHRIYDNASWSEPVVAYYDPPLAIGDASLWLTYGCTWTNESDDVIHYGGSAYDDEMCFVFGYYYPIEKLPVCL
jgi:hypothetical protein